MLQKQLQSQEEEKVKPGMMTIENRTVGVMSAMFNNTASHGGIAETCPTWFDVLILVIGILAVVLNGFLLIAMVRYRSTIFKSKGAYLIANVAISDLINGLNSSILRLKYTFQIAEALTTAISSIFWTSLLASFFTIFVMSLERYIAIVFPFKAQVWLSKTRTIKSCVAVWLIAALCSAWEVVFGNIASFCLIFIFEITILVAMFLYYKIAIKLRQRRTFLTSMQPSGARGTRANAKLQRDYQLMTVVVALAIITILTGLPYMVATHILIAQNLFTAAKYDPNLQLFVYYNMPVQFLNFVVNPIVYAWRLPDYRLALLRTIHCR